ncbi:hypothetical protein EV424DRAFT_1543847 [Suillus variegatus]|nr:hypothetical protein EV424DRAFT_1543847 [Suillus variegatus]
MARRKRSDSISSASSSGSSGSSSSSTSSEDSRISTPPSTPPPRVHSKCGRDTSKSSDKGGRKSKKARRHSPVTINKKNEKPKR